MALLTLSDELDLLAKNRGKFEEVFRSDFTHIRFPRYKNITDGARIDFTFPSTALVGSSGSRKTSVLVRNIQL